MIGRLRRSAAPADEENPYWMSFSDILAGLLIIFILASVILILQLIVRKEQFEDELRVLEQAEQVRRTILAEIKDELDRRGIRVEISENESVVRIPNELLGFETGEFNVQAVYAEAAREIGEVLHEVIMRDNRLVFLDTVFIEGHTDSRPFAGFMGKGNWGLSAFRAISLWQFWSDELPPHLQLDALENLDGMPLFSVSGYAATRPVSAAQTEEEHRRNRRIDIRFTIRRPDSRDYGEVRRIIGGNP